MQIPKLVDVLRAVGHPTRLQMVCLLRAHGEMTVKNLQETTNTKQSLASQQIGILRRTGIIFGRRQGNCVYYRLGAATAPLVDVVTTMRDGQ